MALEIPKNQNGTYRQETRIYVQQQTTRKLLLSSISVTHFATLTTLSRPYLEPQASCLTRKQFLHRWNPTRKKGVRLAQETSLGNRAQETMGARKMAEAADAKESEVGGSMPEGQLDALRWQM
ncbi:hypothetical protein K0M31_000118 [Melipona bicolor]|uniref:Uncharacterized protein n=1 Tax=Melipona bicolor TaxID=60889 RepID=A0AA40GD63_9HYME|nr:hypothetical protein K0M31_000118 [Melipona bicolor]